MTSQFAAYRCVNIAIVRYSVRADRLFSSRGYVFRPGRLQNFLRRIDFGGGIAVYGKQNSTVFDATLITLSFVLRNTHSHERANQTTYCAAHSEAGECTHNRTGGNE